MCQKQTKTKTVKLTFDYTLKQSRTLISRSFLIDETKTVHLFERTLKHGPETQHTNTLTHLHTFTHLGKDVLSKMPYNL